MKIGLPSHLKPAAGEQLRKAIQVQEEVLAVKDQLVPLDNGPLDHNPRRGTLEIYQQSLVGYLRFDPGAAPPKDLRVAISTKPGSAEDETVVFESVSRSDGLQLYRKQCQGLLQLAYVAKNGEVAYREVPR